ncbi:MAG: hypothetical protein HEEMFOPI_02014 [Holosporales bacterium]
MLKFLIISSFYVFSSISHATATEISWVVYNWDLELRLSQIPSMLLNASHPFGKDDVLPVFDEIQKMKSSSVVLESKKDDSERSSSNSSMESVSTTSSSHEYVDALEEIVYLTFNFEGQTAEQKNNRKSFIEVLHSLEDQIDPVVFQKGVELIANQLNN